MKIAILSRSNYLYSTRRLREAAEERGHEVLVLDTLKFEIGVSRGNPELYYRNRPIGDFDAVIPRIGASITFYGLAVLGQFEQRGVYTPNESVAIARSRDKLRATQLLSRHDVGIPPTAFVKDRNDVIPAIERVGGAPVIIKVLEGTQGVGVILAETTRIAEAIIETLQSARQNVLIQKFISESKGRDVRCIVVGDEIVAAMRRMARGDEYRSNVHRGGLTETVELNEEFKHTAIRAAKIMGLHVAGVDMLESAEGPQVLEVNSSPGLEGIENTTNIDVAGAIIDEIESRVLFPEVALHQRLRLIAGYGIAEFPVHNMPEIENKLLRDCNLDQRNIHVLHINRQDSVIPNPKGDETILAGDTLLCYGELKEIRALIPESRKQMVRGRKSGARRKTKRRKNY